ncbi:tripartite tricarboxylate transporter TctB family protein [Thermodesulfobacteriota bacterium]
MNIKSSNFITAFGCLMIFLFVIFYTWQLPASANRFFKITSFFGITLSIILMISSRWEKEGSEYSANDASEKSKYEFEFHELIKSAVWMVSLVPLVRLLGFTVGISIFAFVYYKSHGGSWFAALILGAVMAGAIYLIFVFGMEVFFPKPILLPSLRM